MKANKKGEKTKQQSSLAAFSAMCSPNSPHLGALMVGVNARVRSGCSIYTPWLFHCVFFCKSSLLEVHVHSDCAGSHKIRGLRLGLFRGIVLPPRHFRFLGYVHCSWQARCIMVLSGHFEVWNVLLRDRCMTSGAFSSVWQVLSVRC